MTSDVAGAQRFYPALFGWKTEEFKFADPNQPYTMWKDGGKTFGGVAKLNDEQKKMGVPPSWLVSVMVNNVDETAQKATSLGGKVVAGPFPIPNTGRYAIITDPMGAAIALFTPEGPADSPDVFSWHELMTTDYKRAFDFYQRLFGWEKTGEMDMGGGSMYLMFGQKGRPLGGMYNKGPEMGQVPPNWLPYVAVKDVTASANPAARNGAKVMQPPMDIPGGGSIAVLTDPQGAHIAVHAETGLAKASAKVASKPKKKSAKKAAKKSKPKKAVKKKSAKKKSAPKKKGGSRKAKKSAKKKGRRR